MSQRGQLSQLRVSLAHGSSPRRLQDLRKVPMLTAPWRANANANRPLKVFKQQKNTLLSSWKMTNPFWNKKGTRKCQNKIGKKLVHVVHVFADVFLLIWYWLHIGGSKKDLISWDTFVLISFPTHLHPIMHYDVLINKSRSLRNKTQLSQGKVCYEGAIFCKANPDPSRRHLLESWKLVRLDLAPWLGQNHHLISW